MLTVRGNDTGMNPELCGWQLKQSLDASDASAACLVAGSLWIAFVS